MAEKSLSGINKDIEKSQNLWIEFLLCIKSLEKNPNVSKNFLKISRLPDFVHFWNPVTQIFDLSSDGVTHKAKVDLKRDQEEIFSDSYMYIHWETYKINVV